MNEASSAPEKSASTAAGPALNVDVFRVTFGPRKRAKILFLRPTMADPWVTLAKYPSRSVTGPELLVLALPLPPHAARSDNSSSTATADHLERRFTDPT